jgi:hypothetical protein
MDDVCLNCRQRFASMGRTDASELRSIGESKTF